MIYSPRTLRVLGAVYHIQPAFSVINSYLIVVIIVINNNDRQVGLYSDGLILGGGGGAYIWNEVSFSTCGGLIHGGLYSGGGLIFGGLR